MKWLVFVILKVPGIFYNVHNTKRLSCQPKLRFGMLVGGMETNFVLSAQMKANFILLVRMVENIWDCC